MADNATRVMSDDASYYLVIARHVARGDGATFDGRHATGGYHPLWMLALVPLAALADAPRALLLGAVALQVLLVVASALVVLHTLRVRVRPAAALLGALVWVAFACVSRAALLGLEWGLQALLLALVAALWQRDFAAPSTPTLRACARLGAVLALLFLARLDTLLLAVSLIGALALRRVAARRLAALALPIVLAVTSYATVLWAQTGQARPVSAAVKAEWSQALLERDPLFVERGFLAAKVAQLVWPVGRQRRAFWLPLALGTLGFAALLTRASWRPRLSLWLPFALFAWLQWWALALCYHDGYSFAPWYFVVQPWLAAVLVASLADRLARGPVVAALACAALAAFTLADAWSWRARARTAGEEALYSVARAVRDSVPAGARVGAWNAGQIALLSGRDVTNLDGLVNSREFFERGRRDLCGYLRQEGIAYLADSFPAAGLLAMAPALDACSERLRLVWSQRRDTARPPRLDAVYAFEP